MDRVFEIYNSDFLKVSYLRTALGGTRKSISCRDWSRCKI
jgi:hypothetical protein